MPLNCLLLLFSAFDRISSSSDHAVNLLDFLNLSLETPRSFTHALCIGICLCSQHAHDDKLFLISHLRLTHSLPFLKIFLVGCLMLMETTKRTEIRIANAGLWNLHVSRTVLIRVEHATLIRAHKSRSSSASHLSRPLTFNQTICRFF